MVSQRHADAKPEKPYPDFPLFPHATRRWAKKIRGRFHYFGPWNDPDAALTKYQEQRDDLYAGRVARPSTAEGLKLNDLVNRFLNFKLHAVETGELRRSTLNEYHATCARLIAFLGRSRLVTDVRPEDFGTLRAELAKGLGLAELGKRIQTVRSVFKFGYDSDLLDRPAKFGAEFKKPSAKALRRARAGRGKCAFEAAQLRRLLKASGVQMRAMILLGLNAGFGNTDVAEVPQAALDLTAGVVEFPRPKTGTPRRCPLWPDTVKAVKAAIAARPRPLDPADDKLAFITAHGRRWVRYKDSVKTPGKYVWVDSVNLEFGKLLKELGLKRPGVAFYALRHTFRTVADAVPDRPAVDLIMGHTEAADDMRGRYVEYVDDARLRRVVEHVRAWLFAKRKR
jgi:integrase